jgi:dihydroneopterin aldolase
MIFTSSSHQYYPIKIQQMSKIRLKNIRTYSYHGCLIEEGKIGSDYLVNLEIDCDLSTSALSDELKDTVDYVLLNKIVEEEMAIRSKLLEHAANRIINRALLEAPSITKVAVEVSKINPPIGGDVEQVTIIMSKSRS